MNHDYQLVLRRLREERERRNLTQRLLCYNMKMLQSHYSPETNVFPTMNSRDCARRTWTFSMFLPAKNQRMRNF